MAVQESNYRFNAEKAHALNKEVKLVAKAMLNRLQTVPDREEFFKLGIFHIVKGYEDAFYALSQLWIQHHIGRDWYVFPVFYLSCKELKISGDFRERYETSEALEQILEGLAQSGLSLYVEDKQFLLSFRNYSNLVFTRRGYKVKIK